MRVVLSLLVALLFGNEAIAETRTTTVAVTVRKRPGERAAAVVRIPINTDGTIVREEGRWFLVKVNGAEGYVARTTLTTPAPAVSTTPVWSAPRAPLGDALMVEVTTATASLRATPASDGASIATLARGAKLAVIDATKPSWVNARDAEGRTGWVARGDVADGATAVTLTSEVRDPTVAPSFVRAAPRRLAITTEVIAGYRAFGVDLTSNVDGTLTNYVVDSNAVALSLRGVGTLQLGGRWFVAGDAQAAISAASPGITYQSATSMSGKIPFRTFAAEVGARVGARAGHAFSLALRAAGHYDAFLPDEVENAGMLARERLLGVTAGARIDIVPPHSRISAALRFDVLAFGARAQTPGLEDGASSVARGAWGGITLRFPISRRWSVIGDYEAARATTQWSGRSVRQPSVTRARRVDATQLLQLGIGAEL